MTLFWQSPFFTLPINLTISAYVLIGHLLALYGFYLAIIGQTNSKTIVYHMVCALISLLGVTVGSHRLYSHRSFQVNTIGKIILLLLNNYSGQDSYYQFSRIHRVHHKHTDTEADPSNIRRGLFFAHIGWIMCGRTQEFEEKVSRIDFSDYENDPVLMFHHKYYRVLNFAHWLLSVMIPCSLWNEKFSHSVCMLAFAIVSSMHHVLSSNSFNHWWGGKPYDTRIEPTFNRIGTYLQWGDGYHNYHHVFPKDYATTELKWTQSFNVGSLMIDMFEQLGWVTNKKVTDPQIVRMRRQRTGDLSVKIKPKNVVIDYICGLIVISWGIWLIFTFKFFFSPR